MIISTAETRRALQWEREEVSFSELAERVGRPVVTGETAEQFKAMGKARQDELKDVGGFVMGELLGGRRRKGSVASRSGAALDADSIGGPAGLEDLRVRLAALSMEYGFEYCVYSTRKSAPETPRVRILIPFTESVDPEAYVACALKLCERMGMGRFDPTTAEAHRLMYWPSVSSDGMASFIHETGGPPGGALDVAVFLGAEYRDWRDAAEWPAFPQGRAARAPGARQKDPLEKDGIIGQFCRAHTIQDAIAAYLPDVYEPAANGRYTRAGASTSGGAVVYDDKFLYSFHGSDPHGYQLLNAFDLVRVNLFGDTPESMAKMRELAAADPKVVEGARQATRKRVQEEPGGDGEVPFPDNLDRDPKNPEVILETIRNAKEIMLGDPLLKGRYHYDEFANRMVVDAPMPWPSVCKTHPRQWEDEADDAGLREFMQTRYGLKSKSVIEDGRTLAFVQNPRHPIKDYLESIEWDGAPRLDTLYIDYLGAEDNDYTRAVTRKAFTAAVARVYEPGLKFDTMTILVGAQGIGKSTLIDTMGGDWFSDSLSDFSGKDAFMSVEASWLVEISELEGFTKYEMTAIKNFLAKRADLFRSPFGKKVNEHKRHCVFFGTTNEETFLRDTTGNRRFWPVQLGVTEPAKSVFTDLAAERDQLWAEAAQRYRDGESLILDKKTEAMAEVERGRRMEDNPLLGKISEFVARPVLEDWDQVPTDIRQIFFDQPEAEMFAGIRRVPRTKVCAAEIFTELFREPDGRVDRRRVREVNQILGIIPGLKRADNPMRFGPEYGKQRGFILTDAEPEQ